MDTTQPNPLDYQSYNILIVDDTPVNLEVIIDFLESYGFGIRMARSGENALKRVEYDRPDLILLDVLLPGLDGFETCRRLKAEPATEDIPIIFMTSLTGTEDKVKGFEVGAVDYVTKPLHQEEVLARIKTHLRLRDLTLTLEKKNRQLEVSSRVEKMRLFEAVTQQREQLRSLNSKLTQVQEAERTQLARELHDEMGQALTAISLNLTSVCEMLPPEISPVIKERLAEASWLSDQTLEQVRELSLNLRPPMLDDLGLVPTLLWYIKRYTQRVNIDVNFETVGLEDRIPSILETTVYRIVQEALTNIAKHAKTAKNVQIRLECSITAIAVLIKDDGRGFDVAEILGEQASGSGIGLLGMQERVNLLRGNFNVESQLGQGTCLSITIPWNSD
ncbi:MAG: response regulator [Anaerolineales bacterium]|nr:response regulator [Anaerolineales bacterium]